MPYVKPTLIDLGVLDDVVEIGPDDHDQREQEAEHKADHEVDDDCDGAGPAERPTGAD